MCLYIFPHITAPPHTHGANRRTETVTPTGGKPTGQQLTLIEIFAYLAGTLYSFWIFFPLYAIVNVLQGPGLLRLLIFWSLFGVPMVLRTTKQGRYAGEQFYGCPNFPKCRETAAIQ